MNKKHVVNSSSDKAGDVDSGMFDPIMGCVGNNIYFYDDISSKTILSLNREIKILESTFISEKVQRNTSSITPIYLYIMSSGGSLMSALSSMDTILSCKVPIYTVIDGYCASASTLLAIVGKKRYMRRNSFMLIHQLSYVAEGKYTEIKDETKNTDQWMEILKNIYKKYTKVPVKKLNEVLKHDLWWNAETCLKYGMIDEIL